MISPKVRRRRLAAELKELRESAGVSNHRIGRQLGWSKSKVSRLENDFAPPNAAHVAAFLKALGVDGDKWHELMQMAHSAAERGWWTDFGEHMGARQQVNADFEWGAATITEYMTGFMPGLLQTAEYIRARHRMSMKRGEVTSAVDENQVIEARLTRQRMMRRPNGPKYEVVLDELAVRRPTAPRAVMHDQIRELIRLQTEEPQITIRVLPIDTEVEDYWLPTSAFSRYAYSDPGDPVIVLVEAEGEDLILSKPEQVKPYEAVLQVLRTAALSPSDSTELLRSAADRLKTTTGKS